MNISFTKHITAAILLAASFAATAQEAQTTTPALQPAGNKKKCSMHSWDSKSTLTKGFRANIEWADIYGDSRNQVSYRLFGKTINMNMPWRSGMYMGAGYQFDPYFYLGGGMGEEFQMKAYTITQEGAVNRNMTGAMWVIPIYADIRYYFLNKPITPFLQMKIGYAPTIYNVDRTSIFKSSLYDSMSVGVRLPGCKKMDMNITAGYLFRYQPGSVTGVDESFGVKRATTNNAKVLENRFTMGFSVGF